MGYNPPPDYRREPPLHKGAFYNDIRIEIATVLQAILRNDIQPFDGGDASLPFFLWVRRCE